MGTIQQVVSLKEYVSSSVNGLLSSNKASVEWNHSERVLVEAFTGSTKVVVGKDDTECTPVLVQVTAAPQQPHIPLDVVAVLDVSSSMKGSEKRMEAAMVAVIKNLSRNDRLSLVSLEDVVNDEMPPTLMDRKGRDTATNAITSIISKTRFRKCGKSLGTEALDTVRRQMEKNNTASMAGQQNRMRCVMLLSCGEDQLNMTQWITEITELKFQFCSFDVGDQHDAGRFKCVAEAGASAYHYIVNDSSTSSITDAFGSFVRGLRTVVATSVKLSLKAEEAGGFTISSVETGGHRTSNDSEHQIHIAGMHAGEKKSFVVYLEGAAAAAENILSITGKYQLVSSSSENYLQPCLLPGKDVDVTMKSDVAAEVVRSRLVTEVKEILVKEEIEENKTKQPILVEVEATWKNIELWDIYKVATSCSTDLVKHIQKDVALMKEKGHSYMISWLSCHWWQRATTMSRYSYAFTASSTTTTTPEKDRWRQPCFLGAVGVVFLVLMVMLLRWWRQPLPPPSFRETALDLEKHHPEWPAMKDGLDDLLHGAKDDRITSFFTEKGALSLEMNQQIDQYLYMAILYAAVLRASYEGNTAGALVSEKVVRRHAETYIQTMLTRTKSGVLPSLDVTSHQNMTQAMSKYLYSTIVQAEVLVTIHTPYIRPEPPIPTPNPPVPSIADKEKIKKLKQENSKLVEENKALRAKIKELETKMVFCCEKAKACEQKVNTN